MEDRGWKSLISYLHKTWFFSISGGIHFNLANPTADISQYAATGFSFSSGEKVGMRASSELISFPPVFGVPGWEKVCINARPHLNPLPRGEDFHVHRRFGNICGGTVQNPSRWLDQPKAKIEFH